MENSLNVIRDIILSQDSLESVLDKMTDGFVFFDNDWNIVFWNKSAERIIKKQAVEVVGQNVWDSFPETQDTIIFRQYHHAKQNDTSVEFEVYYEPADCWLEVRAFPQHDGLAVYVKDITSRKRLEVELNKQRTLLTTLMAKGGDMIGIIDATGVYKFASPNVERIFGYAPGELVGQPVHLLIHPDDHAFVFEHLAQVDLLQELMVKDFRFKHKDGSWQWVEVILTNMLDNEIIGGILINSRQITERKEAELKLVSAMESITIQNDALKEIAFLQSHEVRKPVANILGLISLIRETGNKDDISSLLPLLEESGTELDGIIKSIVEKTYALNEVNAVAD